MSLKTTLALAAVVVIAWFAVQWLGEPDKPDTVGPHRTRPLFVREGYDRAVGQHLDDPPVRPVEGMLAHDDAAVRRHRDVARRIVRTKLRDHLEGCTLCQRSGGR